MKSDDLSKNQSLGTTGGELRRNLTLLEATLYSISFVIGTGIFLKPGTVLNDMGSTGGAISVWMLGGLITLCSALTIAEIAAYIPKLGGIYTYITELYGEFVGFMQGWVTMLISGPGGAAASAMAFATFASYFVEMNGFQLRMLAIGIVVFFSIIQMLSTKGSMILQTVGTVGKLIPIFAIISVGLVKGNIPQSINFSLIGGAENGGLALALLGVLWAYDGWVATCTFGDEMIEPEKNLPRSIVLSLTFITIVYAAFNYVVFKVISPEQILATKGTSVGVEASTVLFGSKGTLLISLGMLVSSAVTLNAQIMNSVRAVLAMAERKLIFASDKLRYLNPKFDTPINCILFQIVVMILYIMTGTFDSVTNLVIFVVWIFFVLATYGIFILRKKYPRNDKLYHVPLYPIIPIIGILGGGYLVVATVFSSPMTALLGVGVAIIGLPMYFYSKKKYID